jgi:hypothetical protein
MRAIAVVSSLLLCSSVAWAKAKAPAQKCSGLSCTVAKKAVVDYLGKLPGGWSVTLSKYTEDVKRKGTVITGGYKKLAPNRYYWQAISKRRVDQDWEDPSGPKLYRVFEGMVLKQKGKVKAWRFPTFEEWMQSPDAPF